PAVRRIDDHDRAIIRAQCFHSGAPYLQVFAVYVISLGGVREGRRCPWAALNDRREFAGRRAEAGCVTDRPLQDSGPVSRRRPCDGRTASCRNAVLSTVTPPLSGRRRSEHISGKYQER